MPLNHDAIADFDRARYAIVVRADRAVAADLAHSLPVATVPAPATPESEYILRDVEGTSTGTDGSSTWGGHQSQFVRMADGTEFALGFTRTALVVLRSPTGGAYGGPAGWSTVATIANAARDGTDLDGHLLRNAPCDCVHLIYSAAAAAAADGRAAEYRIRTWNSAGAEIGDVAIADRPPDDPSQDGVAWFASTRASGTLYSAAGIGEDGTIVLTGARSTGPVDGHTPTEMDALLRVQTMRWNGVAWEFSPIHSHPVGPRIAYSRIWVSPPGAPGFAVGVGVLDVKFNAYHARFNPAFDAAQWPNTAANAKYHFPAVVLWKLRLSALSELSVVHLLAATDRATDLPREPTGADYQGYAMRDATIDARGRVWLEFNNPVTGAHQRGVAVSRVSDGSLISRADNVYPAGFGAFHEDANGAMWLLWANIGTFTSTKLLRISESGSGIVVQNQATAPEQRATAFGSNLGNGRYEGISWPPRMPARRNGSSLNANQVDVMLPIIGDFTGVPPGTAFPVPGAGAFKLKRVRIQFPAN